MSLFARGGQPPQLNAREFAQRRKAIAAQLPADAIALIPSAHELIRNRDAEFPFRQDSDFYYLTGFPEPDALAVIDGSKKSKNYTLFCRKRDKTMETWNGRRAGQRGAIKTYEADQSHAIDAVDEHIIDLLANKKTVYYCDPQGDFLGQIQNWITEVKKQARAGISAPSQLIELEPIIHDLRLIKSDAEANMMRHAAKVSAQAHIQAMLASSVGGFEYQLEAEILYEFRRHNCVPAYNTIVGAGANGCILHYTENQSVLKKNQLVLIDAGAEYGNYAADITRTFPVDGKFTEPQRLLYGLVLEAQYAAIDMVKPGKTFMDAHETAVKVLTRGLVKLGLLKGRVASLIKDKAYSRFYMHRTGHWLGMDVHDVGPYKVEGKWRKLKPGMVVTVEPGLYISNEHKDIDRQWHNIGIRIEDDVLVTARGNEVLTRDVPKTVEEIENLMADGTDN